MQHHLVSNVSSNKTTNIQFLNSSKTPKFEKVKFSHEINHKQMKKAVIIFVSIFAVLLIAAAAVPFLFKDKIKAKIDEEIAQSVNADVVFDTDKFGITLFKDFPNITVTLEDFGIVGRDEFEGEVLLAVKKFELEANLKSVIFDDQVRLKGITLVNPKINIKVLENGKANYEIMIPTEEKPEETSDDAEFSMGIDQWEIVNGDISYSDESIPFSMTLEDVNHTGSGDFGSDVFDMKSLTDIAKTTINFDGIEYLANKKLNLDMVLNMDLKNMKFTFKDNTAIINDLPLKFDGYFAMPTDDYEMDITFSSPESSFKSLLSLVPGVYKEDFNDITTAGSLAFSGFVKGVYNETTMPAFNVNLKVADAMFQYPDLPTAVKNINVDMLIDSKDFNNDDILIDIKKFVMDLGNNPINAVAKIKGLEKPNINAAVKAKLNLADLGKMFPMDGLTMKGLFNLDLKANGVYDSLTNRFPNVKSNMTLKGGNFKYSEYPVPLENVNFASEVTNTGGKMENTLVVVDYFDMLLDGEKVEGSLTLKDLVNYTWDAKVKGIIDLEKITKIFPLDSMQLSGKIKADITSKGQYSDLEAERYSKIPTSGIMSIANFNYESADLPQGFSIANANASFSPEKINIKSFKGRAGKTDMNIDGYVSNYINYIFNDNATLKGNMNFRSQKVDVNEWMTEEEVATDDSTSQPMEVVEIPKNIDFTLNSNIANVDYDNMKLKNVKGIINVKDGKVIMNDVNFNSLGGTFAMNGTYDSRDIKHPTYNFEIDMKEVSIKESYNTFNTVKAFAPIAQFVNGKFSTDFKLNGELGQDMLPLLSTISGSGLINIVNAVLEKNNALNKVSSLMDDNKFGSNMALKDLLLQTEIKDGKLNVKPFDVKLGDYMANVTGSTGFDGAIKYDMKLDIPAGAYGAKLNGLLSSVSGSESTNETIQLPIQFSGTFLSPKVKLGNALSKENLSNQVKDIAKQKLTEQILDNKDKLIKDSNIAKYIDSAAINDTKAQLKAKQDSLKRVYETEKKKAEDSVRRIIEKQKEDAKKKAKDKIKGFFK